MLNVMNIILLCKKKKRKKEKNFIIKRLKIKMNKLSYKVMKMDEYHDTIFYRIACACGDQDHDFTLWLEYDREINDITMMIEKKLYWNNYYNASSWYKRIWERLRDGIVLIFGGYLEMQADILFNDKEHITGFIQALEEAKNKFNIIEDKNEQ